MFADLRPAFPTGPSVCSGGGGGGGNRLHSKHKLWNFHRYRLVVTNIYYNNTGSADQQPCVAMTPWLTPHFVASFMVFCVVQGCVGGGGGAC